MTRPVSLIATVLNEVTTIRTTLDAIFAMTRVPDEVVIVDGGSSDGTAEAIREVAGMGRPVRLVVEPNCTIARGRNIAIEHASHELIAVIDGGAVPDKRWLEFLIAPFERPEHVDVVAGWTILMPETTFERYVAMLQRPFSKIDPDQYLPSARSLAFPRSCWREVGKFPEELTNWAEDTVFMERVKQRGYRITIVPEAVVFWRPRGTMKQFWLQHFRYGFGDGEGNLHARLYGKRALLVLALPVGVWGIIASPITAVVAFLVLAWGFFRLVMPLRFEKVQLLHLPALLVLTLWGETARVVGYLYGKGKSPRGAT